MNAAPFRLVGRGSALLLVAVSACALAACSASQPKVTETRKSPARSTEYFAESEYGVKASPRVTNQRSGLRRGGGRDQLGRPYRIRGQLYTPREDPNYRATGIASWYGDAFHGRLTANGEIYDMTHLTAAHPTMPLPSYARVTNKANGNSLIVRVNDRGPFARGRVIDLSRRSAELLDFTRQGVARVDVEYLGRAPLHGQDDAFLMASYRPGGSGAPDPSDGMPSGVMIAMSGPTPTASAGVSSSFPGQMRTVTPSAAPAASPSPPAGDFALPDAGPLVPARPGIGLADRLAASPPTLGYADERVKRAARMLEDFAENRMASADMIEALNRRYAEAAAPRTPSEYVAVGTYGDRAAAEAMARALAGAGRAEIEAGDRGDGFALNLHPDGGMGVDDMLRTAWAAGAADAMTVRD